jgi:uncharacterized OB-fold protein
MQVSRHWRLNAQRYALQGVICPHCAANIFPPREICPYCEGHTQDAYHFETHRQRAAAPAKAAFEPAAR